jgi:hypothetical protein
MNDKKAPHSNECEASSVRGSRRACSLARRRRRLSARRAPARSSFGTAPRKSPDWRQDSATLGKPLNRECLLHRGGPLSMSSGQWLVCGAGTSPTEIPQRRSGVADGPSKRKAIERQDAGQGFQRKEYLVGYLDIPSPVYRATHVAAAWTTVTHSLPGVGVTGCIACGLGATLTLRRAIASVRARSLRHARILLRSAALLEATLDDLDPLLGLETGTSARWAQARSERRPMAGVVVRTR